MAEEKQKEVELTPTFEEKHPRIAGALSVAGAVAVGLIVIGIWDWLGHRPMSNSDIAAKATDTSAQYGDSFGAVNALFSALAFAGVIIALWWQRKELSLQRREMRLAWQEHKKSADAQTKSEQRLMLSAFIAALETLRQVGDWRSRHQIPARSTHARTIGVLAQAQVIDALNALIPDMASYLYDSHEFLQFTTEAYSRSANCQTLAQIAKELGDVGFIKHGRKNESLDDTKRSTVSSLTNRLIACATELSPEAEQAITECVQSLRRHCGDPDVGFSSSGVHQYLGEMVCKIRAIAEQEAFDQWH